MIWQALLRSVERRMNLNIPAGVSEAETDQKYYDTDALTPAEKQQALDLTHDHSAPEGTILVVEDGADADGFEVIRCPDDRLDGRQRGEAVVGEFLKRHWPGDVRTIAIPGNATSPLGAAAFAKAVAKIVKQPVAAIVVGQGAYDKWNESFAGAFLMSIPANMFNALDPLIEVAAQSNPVLREGLRAYVNQVVDAIDEASTLCALLRNLIVDEHCKLRDPPERNLDLLVSHSKANWGLQAALINFELDLGEKIADQSAAITRPVDVVTFGNPVDLPDMMPIMRSLFRYHQFVGDSDYLGMKCSWRDWQLSFKGPQKLDPRDPKFDPRAAPEEWLVADVGHHLVDQQKKDGLSEVKPYHMPIEIIIPAILKATS